jgi:hypothetical protein
VDNNVIANYTIKVNFHTGEQSYIITQLYIIGNITAGIYFAIIASYNILAYIAKGTHITSLPILADACIKLGCSIHRIYEV